MAVQQQCGLSLLHENEYMECAMTVMGKDAARKSVLVI